MSVLAQPQARPSRGRVSGWLGPSDLRGWLRILGIGLTAGLALSGCGPTDRRSASDLEVLSGLSPKPNANILIISFDALRADALGLYGFDRPTSPRLDAFSQRCLVFDRAYTAAPVTPTSFASAFTGLLPHRVFHDWDLVWRDTLASRFAESGYVTGAFFNNLQLSVERNFHTGFDTYEVYRSVPDEEVVESSLAWLGEHREEKIFAWIHFLSPHSPYDARDMASHLYEPEYEGRFQRTSTGKFETDDPAEIRRLRTLYDGEVLYADGLFGQLLDGLEANGFLDDSIVLVTSDHGEEFMEHGGFQHDRLTEEHVRIPLLLYHPDLETPGRSQILASNLDLFPTLLGLAGIDADVTTDGRDLRRLSTEPDRVVGVSQTGATDRWLSLRSGSQKLILTCMPETATALYDLERDPGELVDLSDESPADVARLREELDAIMGGEACSAMQAAVRGVDATRGLPQDTIDALRELGYLE